MTKVKEEDASNKPIKIRQVWAENLEGEFDLIRDFVHMFPYVSMDTEFPGVVVAPNFDPNIPYHLRHMDPSEQYSFLKANVDNLNLIQLGLTLTDANGNLPGDVAYSYIWEFNFKDFDVDRDLQNPDSIELLRRQGIDFKSNLIYGVDSLEFAKLFRLKSGLVNSGVSWVTFHSSYDFGYLVKILTQNYLPSRLEEFLSILTQIFGQNVYDMKYMIKFCNLYGGLERVATKLKVSRAVGNSHQAASDSLLTWQAFKKMKDIYFVNNGITMHAGVLFGLEVTV